MGIAGVDIIARIVEVINGLYDSVEKRLERINKEKQLNEKLSAFLIEGGTLKLNGQKRKIFHGSLLHYDNQISSPTYYFAFIEIFNPQFEDDHLEIPNPIIIQTDNFIFEDDQFVIQSRNDNGVTVTKVNDAQHKKKFSEFIEQLSNCLPASAMLNFKIGEERTWIKQEIGRKLATQSNLETK